jgi:hypothetical protein
VDGCEWLTSSCCLLASQCFADPCRTKSCALGCVSNYCGGCHANCRCRTNADCLNRADGSSGICVKGVCSSAAAPVVSDTPRPKPTKPGCEVMRCRSGYICQDGACIVSPDRQGHRSWVRCWVARVPLTSKRRFVFCNRAELRRRPLCDRHHLHRRRVHLERALHHFPLGVRRTSPVLRRSLLRFSSAVSRSGNVPCAARLRERSYVGPRDVRRGVHVQGGSVRMEVRQGHARVAVSRAGRSWVRSAGSSTEFAIAPRKETDKFVSNLDASGAVSRELEPAHVRYRCQLQVLAAEVLLNIFDFCCIRIDDVRALL